MGIETNPVVLTDTLTKPEETVKHYVCCRIPNTETCVTTAFCGESTFFDGRSNNASIICPLCAKLAQRDYCPLGRDCEVVG